MTDRGADLAQAEVLLRAHKQLAAAADPEAIVAALARVCEPHAPTSIALLLVQPGEDGAAEQLEVAAAWSRSGSVAPAIGRRLAWAAYPPGQAARAAAPAPVFTADAHADALGLPEPARSLVLLPLYAARQAAWQGFVALHWAAPREPGPAERMLYEMLMSTLAESVAAERTLHAYRCTLADNAALLQRSEAALQESQRQRATLRTLLDHLPLGVAVVRVDEHGKLEVITSAGKIDLKGFGERIDLTTVVVHEPGESTPMRPERMPAFRALQSGQTERGEMEVPLPDGSRALLETSATPLRLPGDPATYLVALYNDITEIRRGERERLEARERLLEAQALALAERSTPLIPIRRDVLILPLVGAIDEERGRQVLETLVGLGGRTGVRAAIVDVTGVRDFDDAAARALLGAAQALRLRGVRPILTGIQSAAASALVELGVDFTGIAVRATLQDGVDLATAGRG